MSNDLHVIGTFQDKVQADMALTELNKSGFLTSQISLLVTADGAGHHFQISDDQTKCTEGVGYGAVLGALVAGLAAAALPGSIFIAGPAAALLASGASGAAAGGLLGGLIGLGIPEAEAKLIEGEAGRGSIVIAVHQLDSADAKTVADILKNNGASRVHS